MAIERTLRGCEMRAMPALALKRFIVIGVKYLRSERGAGRFACLFEGMPFLMPFAVFSAFDTDAFTECFDAFNCFLFLLFLSASEDDDDDA